MRIFCAVFDRFYDTYLKTEKQKKRVAWSTLKRKEMFVL